MPPRIRVEQQLVRVEAVALIGLIGAVHAIAIDCARPDPRHVAMPNLIGVFGEIDARGLALAFLVEQADLDSARMRREQGEIDAVPVPGGPERVWQPLGDLGLVHISRCPVRSRYTL